MKICEQFIIWNKDNRSWKSTGTHTVFKFWQHNLKSQSKILQLVRLLACRYLQAERRVVEVLLFQGFGKCLILSCWRVSVPDVALVQRVVAAAAARAPHLNSASVDFAAFLTRSHFTPSVYPLFPSDSHSNHLTGWYFSPARAHAPLLTVLLLVAMGEEDVGGLLQAQAEELHLLLAVLVDLKNLVLESRSVDVVFEDVDSVRLGNSLGTEQEK